MCRLVHIRCVNSDHVLQDSDYDLFEYDAVYLKVGTSVKDKHARGDTNILFFFCLLAEASSEVL